MIDWPQAWKIAGEHVATYELPGDDQPVLLADDCREYPFGWLFFYQSKTHVDTGDRRFALLGNVPFIVDRRDGSVHVTRTNWAEAVAEYQHRFAAGDEPPSSGAIHPDS